jgi:hypothetical protein
MEEVFRETGREEQRRGDRSVLLASGYSCAFSHPTYE